VDEETWERVDGYVQETLLGEDPVLAATARSSAAAGLPPIAVSAPQGKMLTLLAKIHGARRVLELGTLGGYSTICLARGLPSDGRLVTLEANPAHARVAAENIRAAGYAELVDVRVGPALETLPRLAREAREPFDLVFIDADKESTPDYFEWSLRLTRPGAVILADNVVRGGALADPADLSPGVRGMRAFHQLLANEPRVEATTIQTVGGKGYDGFTLVRVMP
jgi:predicted O-methyltransferase YrrM